MIRATVRDMDGNPTLNVEKCRTPAEVRTGIALEYKPSHGYEIEYAPATGTFFVAKDGEQTHFACIEVVD